MQSVQIVAFLAVPEIITKRRDLRKELDFIGNSEDLWDTLRSCLNNRTNLNTGVFVHGVGELRWKVRGNALVMSIHQLRLANDYAMKHRMPIPLIAQHASQLIQDRQQFHVVNEIRIYPNLFAEAIVRVSTPMHRPIPTPLIEQVASTFRSELGATRRKISMALFGDKEAIRSSFSNFFTIDVNREARLAGRKLYSINTSGKNKIRVALRISSRLFAQRIVEGVSLAIVQRIVNPILWSHLKNINYDEPSEIREMIETLLVSNSQNHYVYSKKTVPHILPWGYQRQAFEIIAKKMNVRSIDEDIRGEFIEWLDQIPFNELIPLLDCTPPLGPSLKTGLARRLRDPSPPHLQPPASTLFDYLVLAYLADRYKMLENPTVYKIAADRLGLRTANKIDEGMTRLEQKTEYRPHHKKSDLYEVPGPTLRALSGLGLITSVELRKTQARMAFRVNHDNQYVRQRCIELKQKLTVNEIGKYGA